MKAVGVAMVVALALVGCQDEKGLGDAPVGERHEAKRDIFVMPDTYSNVAVFCDGSTRVYVTTDATPPVAVANSPECGGGR